MNRQMLGVLFPLVIPGILYTDVDSRPAFELISSDVDDEAIHLQPGMGATVFITANVVELSDIQAV